MKRANLSLVVALSALSSIAYSQPKRADVPSYQSRASSIASGEKLVGGRSFGHQIGEDLLNPFAPKYAKPKENVPEKVARPISDREFLETLAAQLNPTGVLMLGDSALLTFREKKVKVGEMMKIVFDNHSYEVELVDVNRTAFTIKFNNVEVTRPIKSAKAP